MTNLRGQVSRVRPNNQRVSEWVDNYLNDCALHGREVMILTQWCISKDLETRWWATSERFFEPTKRERQIFAKELPSVLEMFDQVGLRVSWWLTFNRSYLDSGRIGPDIERAYKEMVKSLAKPMEGDGRVILLDWEDEVLRKRPEPTAEDLSQLVPTKALEAELGRHGDWVRNEARLTQTEGEIRRDALFQIACEAEEGKLLLGPDSPLGRDFIIIPLEMPERYDFFTLLAPNFKERIVAALHLYPWRTE